MIDLIQIVISVFILIFSGLSFWYQFLRTPRSNIKVSVKEREKPYSTEADGITIHTPPIRLFNQGDMEAIVDNFDLEGKLINSKSSEEFPPPDENSFKLPLPKIRSRGDDKIPPGGSVEWRPKIHLRNLSEFPDEFEIKLHYSISIRDNGRVYEMTPTSELRFQNLRAQQRSD